VSLRADNSLSSREPASTALRRSAGILALAVLVVVSLAACSGEPEVVEPVVTTPQASLAGDWELTRTVVSSNDESNPDRLMGAVSTRVVSITQSACETVLCPGTVSSGPTVESRQTTELAQIDGGAQWVFSGTLDCLNQTSGLVQVSEAFAYTQTVQLLATETEDRGGVNTAIRLEGTITFTDSLTLEAHNAGCKRDPIDASVDYSVVAVRPAAEVPATTDE
jgi:hypothetical protein